MRASPVRPVRCAIYTRVSTDQGVDQEFNSLDAQYDASSAYIKSQAHAGWTRRPLAKGIMTIRSRRETVTFKHPFRIRGRDRLLPAGSYEVITDEEMIEGLSFAAFRRVATMIGIPGEGGGRSR